MDIGQAIHTCRLKRKILQKDLARKVGISASLLSMIEKGRRDPGFELIKKISESLDVPYELLLLLVCDPAKTKRKYSKAMRSIAEATLKILQSL